MEIDHSSSLLALQGPKAEEVLAPFVPDIDKIPEDQRAKVMGKWGE